MHTRVRTYVRTEGRMPRPSDVRMRTKHRRNVMSMRSKGLDIYSGASSAVTSWRRCRSVTSMKNLVTPLAMSVLVMGIAAADELCDDGNVT